MDKKTSLILYDDTKKLVEQANILADKLKVLTASNYYSPNNELYVFAIAICILTGFIGYQIVRKTQVSLYQVLIVISTTLSSVAIMSVFSIVKENQLNFSTIFSFFMIVILSASVVSGLIMTYRMLNIFNKNKHDL